MLYRVVDGSKPQNLRYILFERPLIRIYVIKYQILAHFRVWLGAYLRVRLCNNLVSLVGADSVVGAYSRGVLSITVV